jgi:hypothetical protein
VCHQRPVGLVARLVSAHVPIPELQCAIMAWTVWWSSHRPGGVSRFGDRGLPKD